ncbi:MAG: hypothetical protein K6E94_06130 [Elusimicrobiaceae bacterium]|nr:hypothetical protein [Elusimicrobiaceae bacterium]
MKFGKVLASIWVIFLLCACTGPSVRYKQKVIGDMQNHNFEASQARIKDAKKTYGRRDASLYYLDLSTQQDSINYSTNTLTLLTEAENRQADLYAKSISQKLATFIVNGYTEPYRLKYFELGYLFFYKILAYLQQNNLQDAVVETRTMVFFLDKLRNDTGKDDPFLQYFASQLFLMWGAYSDARICKENAENGYSRYADSYAKMPARVNITEYDYNKGLLTVQHLNGMIPFLISKRTMVAWNRFGYAIGTTGGYESVDQNVLASALAGAYGNAIAVALPAVQEVPYRVKGSRLLVDGQVAAETTLASNLTYWFQKNFDEEYNKIFISSAVRAGTKFLITKAAQKKMSQKDDTMGMIVDVLFTSLFTATENADTRSWFTLPAQIREANVLVEEGKHEIKLQLLDEYNKVLDEHVWKDVQINRGRHTYLYVRTAK